MNDDTSRTVPYLAKLNDDQRRAVEHGVIGRGANVAPPLLVIAGAGSGKTNTLAHRVAHLIVNGADPARILLLTFSRRAAAEMDSRAQRIVAAALGTAHGSTSIALPGWDVSCHRCAYPAPVRSRDRSGAQLHHPRPRGLCRSHEFGAP